MLFKKILSHDLYVASSGVLYPVGIHMHSVCNLTLRDEEVEATY